MNNRERLRRSFKLKLSEDTLQLNVQAFLEGLWNSKENEILLGQLLKFEEVHELMGVLYQCRFPDLECCMLVI